MNFFRELSESLTNDVTVTFHITYYEGVMTVFFLPKYTDETLKKFHPAKFIGTPQECDEVFYPQLKEPIEIIVKSLNTIKEITKEVEDAKKKPATPAPATPPKPGTTKPTTAKTTTEKPAEKPAVDLAKVKEQQEKEKKVRILLSQADTYVKLKSYHPARTMCNRALDVIPDHAGAKEKLAQVELLIQQNIGGDLFAPPPPPPAPVKEEPAPIVEEKKEVSTPESTPIGDVEETEDEGYDPDNLPSDDESNQ